MDLYFLSKVSFSDSIFAVFPCRGSSVQTKNRGLQYNDSGTTFYIYSFPFINSAKFAFKLNNFQSWSKINNKIANLHHRKGQSEEWSKNFGKHKLWMTSQDLISTYSNDDASKIKKIAESINQRWFNFKPNIGNNFCIQVLHGE